MGLTEAGGAEQDRIVFVGNELQAEEVLHLQAIEKAGMSTAPVDNAVD